MATDTRTRFTELTIRRGSKASPTDGDGNPAPSSSLAKGIFYRLSATDEADGNQTEESFEEEQWAKWAALSLKEWAEKNPY